MSLNEPTTWEQIARKVEADSGIQLQVERRSELAGGCINAAWLVEGIDPGGLPIQIFLKGNHLSTAWMFEAERLALEELSKADAIRVPRAICSGIAGEVAFLALEFVAMQTGGSARQERLMGEQLAGLHRQTSDELGYGWDRDNACGRTLQVNRWQGDWLTFFRDQRLGFQFQLAEERGRRFRGWQRLLDSLPGLLGDHDPVPSLLHGDLWGGNAGFGSEGEPVVFDPATYYGDRETDIAFSELFGGFGSAFYQGYQSAWPLDSGFERRKTLYNLYHVLNHDHLFGGGYGNQAQVMIDQLLAAPGAVG